jgi:hypothetical protein
MTTLLAIDDVEASVWLSAVEPYQSALIGELLSSGLSEEEAAEVLLSRASAGHTAAFGGGTAGSNLYSSIKAEVRKLICGDPDYEEIRKQASAIWSGQKYSVVALIAGVVALKLGLAVVAVTPIVALIFAAARKLGLNAWCNATNT